MHTPHNRHKNSAASKDDPSRRAGPDDAPGAAHQGGQGQGQGRGANPGQEKREEPTEPAATNKRQDPATPKTDDPYKVAKGRGGKAKDARSRLADVGEAAEQKD